MKLTAAPRTAIAMATATAALLISTPAATASAAASATASANFTAATVTDASAATTAGVSAVVAGWSGKRKLRMGYHDKCKGWYRVLPPYKSGKYIKSSVQVHCAKGGWGRNVHVKSQLQQYRGLGFWRTKSTREHKDSTGTPAFTVTLSPRWKCSGGSQLYRNDTRVHLFSVLDGSKVSTLRRSADQRRIRC